MSRANSKLYLLLAAVLILESPAHGQQPRLSSGQPVIHSATPGLGREFRALVGSQATPVWIGYAVPMVRGSHNMCCGNAESAQCCGRCSLEGDDSNYSRSKSSGRVSLESDRLLHVLFRVDQRRVQKIRTFSGDCELDTGGLTFHWFTAVQPKESIALLASFVAGQGDADHTQKRLVEGALAAIAFHDDDSADHVLEGFIAAERPEFIREKTSFWLGVARARQGYLILRGMLHSDPSERVREQVIFALSLSQDAEAAATLIDAAKNDKSEHVRGQALFWLAQKAGHKAVETISDAIENDPDTEVKKKAVFALSQLPADDGVPRLIQVARTNKNPEVRKQAIFWLGQSGDTRALSFFEEVLTR